MVSEPTLLSVRQVAKRFPNGTQALSAVSLEIRAGEVHGLLGANGAGKSTLIGILSGAMPASGGTIRWRGAEVAWRRPIEARRAGVATIYQHLPLVPTLSALENILLERRTTLRNDPAGRRDAARIVAALGNPFDLDALVATLPIGARQMVAIAQALASGADLLIMDEPTASLGAADRETVYATVRDLARRQGKAVLFVSHFLDEILALTDRVTVLRNGCDIACRATATLDEHALAELISGRPVRREARIRRPRRDSQAALLDLSRQRRDGGEDRLRVGAGEIVGIAGMLGSGRSALLHAIFGARRDRTTTVRVDGAPVTADVEDAIRAGIALVPEDRKTQGFAPSFTIAETIALTDQSGGWLIDRQRDTAAAEAAIQTLAIRAPGPEATIDTLSGGNAQKVLLAKWLSPNVRILLLDEPAAGVDVGARADILRAVQALADDGCSAVMVSSDFDELLALSDRIVVMRDGAIAAEVDPAEVTQAELTVLAGGSSGRVREGAA